MGMGWGGWGWRDHGDLREAARHEKFDAALVRRALGAFRPYVWPTVAAGLLIFATSALGALPPVLTKEIIDRGIAAHDLRAIVRYTALTVAIALVSGLLGVAQNYLTNLVGQKVMADFRSQLFRHIHRQSMAFFTENQSGQLVSRVTNDVGAIQGVVTGTLVNLATNVLVISTTVGIMLAFNWRLTVLSLLILPAFILPTQHVGRVRQDLQRRIQQALGTLTAQLTETLGVSGALLVKAFARERYEFERFERTNREIQDLQVRQSLVGRWLFMWLGLFGSVGPALLYAYGGWLVIRGQLSLGTIIAFVAYLNRLYGPLAQTAQLHVNVLTSIALFRRIYAILDRVPEIQDGPYVLRPEAVRGAIAFEDVTFRYGPALPPALEHIELEIRPGQVVALVGPSGAGKSTLMSLVLRLYDPTAGRVTLDGRDLRELQLESLRSVLGLVPQEPFLFHDTVRANLRYARPDASDEELEAACRAAQIHDVIAAMPQGYDTVVGERGYRLSGGEKQRLAIARVLLRAPRIVLLDEATSSLDTLAERRIQAALEHLLAGRTALVIAHRLSTVLAADRIVVLDRGRVVAVGSHQELLAAGGLYARLYREQFATEAADGRPAPGSEREGEPGAPAVRLPESLH
jgi:ATP-binding cassette subfamily B protein